jgi:hypothetical protein
LCERPSRAPSLLTRVSTHRVQLRAADVPRTSPSVPRDLLSCEIVNFAGYVKKADQGSSGGGGGASDRPCIAGGFQAGTSDVCPGACREAKIEKAAAPRADRLDMRLSRPRWLSRGFPAITQSACRVAARSETRLPGMQPPRSRRLLLILPTPTFPLAGGGGTAVQD